MTKIPTIKELYTNIIADLEASFGGKVPVYGKVFLAALAGVQAAKLKLFYLSLAKVQKNIFVDQADLEASGGTLERFGRIKLGRNPFPAVAGQYTVSITGNAGAIVKASTTFKSDDSSANPSKLFVLDEEYECVGVDDTLTIRALESGLNSKLEISDTLTATAPIANVDSGATVESEDVEPLSSEDIEDYRTKVIESYRLEPQGGASTDYRLWSADATGVRKVYPFAASGKTAEVNLYVEATPEDSTDGYGTPSAAILEDVEEVIEFDPDITKPLNERGRRPLGVFQVNYLPVVPIDVDIEVQSYLSRTTDKETAIETSIEETLNEIRPFVAGADHLSEKNDILSTNTIVAAIFNGVPGSVFGAVTMSVNGLNTTSYVFENGSIPKLNSITYV